MTSVHGVAAPQTLADARLGALSHLGVQRVAWITLAANRGMASAMPGNFSTGRLACSVGDTKTVSATTRIVGKDRACPNAPSLHSISSPSSATPPMRMRRRCTRCRRSLTLIYALRAVAIDRTPPLTWHCITSWPPATPQAHTAHRQCQRTDRQTRHHHAGPTLRLVELRAQH